jgi:hypothetical protein
MSRRRYTSSFTEDDLPSSRFTQSMHQRRPPSILRSVSEPKTLFHRPSLSCVDDFRSETKTPSQKERNKQSKQNVHFKSSSAPMPTWRESNSNIKTNHRETDKDDDEFRVGAASELLNQIPVDQLVRPMDPTYGYWRVSTHAGLLFNFFLSNKPDNEDVYREITGYNEYLRSLYSAILIFHLN